MFIKWSLLQFGQFRVHKRDKFLGSKVCPRLTKAVKIIRRIANSLWLQGLIFPITSMLYVSGTWIILYRLTDSMAAALALASVQLLVFGYCYVQYRKVLAAIPAPSPS